MRDDLLTEPAQNPSDDRQASFQDALGDATPIAFVTPGLIAVNVLIFLLMTVRGVPFLQPNAHQVLPWGANFGPLTSGSGQWWRLLTACFLHFGFLHIAVNMYILWQVGLFTERLFGNVRYLVLYLLAGVGGNIAGLFFHPFAVGAGASGAIFGVYGGLLGFLLMERGVVPAQAAAGIAKSAGLFVLYNLVAGFARPDTDQVAHIGGILTGFLVGGALARPLGIGRQHVQAGRAVLVTAVFAVAGVFAVRHLPAQSAAQASWYRAILTGRTLSLPHNDRVVYTGSVTQAEAQSLAQVLQRVGLFQHPDVVVLLERGASGATLSIPLRAEDTGPTGSKPGAARPSDAATTPRVGDKGAAPPPWNNPAVLLSFQIMGPEIASAAGGPPLTVQLLNGRGELQRTIVIKAGEVAVGAHDRVAYSGVATATQASALGSALQQAGFLHDLGALVVLNRTDASSPPEVSLFAVDGAWDDAHAMSDIAAMVGRLAPSIGGLPVVLRVLDTKGQVRKQMDIR
ncbi:MAG: rhomboid family intramembrane serine protease [Acidobacteriota bacterium]|nr:rhomboid family intramembrane serine protease [Acidobacteriota bacterium]